MTEIWICNFNAKLTNGRKLEIEGVKQYTNARIKLCSRSLT